MLVKSKINYETGGRTNQETQHGYPVLADISGYTSYLAGVELTPARQIIRAGLRLALR
jgi:hypothetical protein